MLPFLLARDFQTRLKHWKYHSVVFNVGDQKDDILMRSRAFEMENHLEITQ